MKIKHTLAAVCMAWGVAAAPQAGAVDIDVASTFPKDMLFLGDGLKQFAKALEQTSGGDIKVKIHGAGDLVPALEVLNAVSSGAVSAGYDWVGYWGGIMPVANLVGALPFGPTPEVLAGWIWEGGGMQIIQKAYDAHNVKFLPCVVVPAEPAGWFNKEINSVDDLKGLKMRIGGLAGRALTKLDVSPQMIPGGEVFVALERGRIDAAEFSLPAIDESIQLQKAGKYYYFPGWHQPSSINSIPINMKVWKSFNEKQQDQILTACRSSFLWTLTNGIPNQLEALDRMEKGGTIIKRLPEPVLAALRKSTDEVVAEERKKDPIFDEAFESLNSYMSSVDRWNTLQNMK
ncbi:TRAP transporter substrate-binding protein [Pusillimonas sp. ANT_WB101]|uniref:TRAP transporter substrate-binding protein n=1 Tax=Pusillimonas sp. ANT_WB101 TaxID=2597356 RepID=UPI0011EC4428|nr:TRAP transporter substrate-binding protein [Pusillimonas sp. ANT_WB101]KAA0892843.1 TRAP transporter substrate-binding protein [Pusillimonas sp. ANT_WB101]